METCFCRSDIDVETVLTVEGIDSIPIVPEEVDNPMQERVEQANKHYAESGKHINCPAGLVENSFQDNKEDVDFLFSEKGRQCVTGITVEGIKKYLANK